MAEKLNPGHHFLEVEPLMVGIGRKCLLNDDIFPHPLGFNLYAFQARAGLMTWHSKPDEAAGDIAMLARAGIDLFACPLPLFWESER